ncbi:MAG: phosphomannomutase/phosphoglucomutase [Phycisphaeraceae bacterium]
MTLSKIFKAYDVRAIYPDPLNEAAAWKVGCATGQYLKQHVEDAEGDLASLTLPHTVVMSRDMRPHSESLSKAFIEGVLASGMNVIDVGMCDTSFIYFAINHLNAAGGVQVTASHNPINYNGFKISGPYAKPIGATTGLKVIEAIAEKIDDPDSFDGKGAYEERDLWEPYREHVLKFYTPPKGGRVLKVAVDAAGGMGGKLVPKVFSNLPGLQIIPINMEITGTFAHDPNPLVPANMKPTQDAVLKGKADMGASFDGDADRCILCDEKGEVIGCDHLTALLVDHFTKDEKGATVVYDLRSSKALEEAITKAGAWPKKGRVGHVFMKATLRETKGVFGGELSGHFYFRDSFYTDSGAIAFAAILSVLGQSDKPLSEMVAPFKKYPQSGEINFRTEDKDAVLAELEKKYADAAIDKLDGVSIDDWSKKGWWFNVRASNTEPLLRLNAEAKDRATLAGLMKEIKPMLGTEDHGH